MATPAPTAAPPAVCRGVVKQVLSGDAVIVRGQPKGGPPPERQINFTNVVAPRIARRATANQPETTDEPYAWEAREFLRKKVIGKEVLFTVETKTPTGREYGCLYLGSDIENGENVVDTMVKEGLLTVRRESLRGESKLTEFEDSAKSASKGKWAGHEADHVRDVKWTCENMRAYVDKAGGKPIPAVIEHIRDGSTVRCTLVPDMQYITLMISGIRCPMNKLGEDGKIDPNNKEPFADESRYYTESRMLQRDIEVVLETFNNNNFVGSIVHPNGNIAESLLREGFARCVDWAMATVTGGPEKLRAAEKTAKELKVRLWKDFKPTSLGIADKDKDFMGKVIEVVNGDALVVKRQDGTVKKIFLASIRPPRLEESERNKDRKQFRPLYDIPWLFEAREFLRKKLIGQKVHVKVDYIQPAQNNFPEKTACTVKIGDINVAEAMVSKGFATVVRYRQDDDKRASCYDDLLSAEAKALKSAKGLHNKKDVPIHRVADISGDIAKAKGFLPFLQRAGRTEAVVEFVASGSRVRLFIPRETCLITFLLGGITCPRATRPAPGGIANGTIPGEPFGEEAYNLTKSLCLQKEVEIEVDSMDKGGNFIGWLHVDSKNLSVHLVEEGLSKMHVTAESSNFFNQLTTKETAAKQKKLNIWSTWNEADEKAAAAAASFEVDTVTVDRKVDYKPMMISEVKSDGTLYGQYCSDGPALETMMENLRKEFSSNPPLGGAYTPKRGDICAAKFVDGSWYRAKIEKISGLNNIAVFYIDFGNREVTTSLNCASLPSAFSVASTKGYAHELHLAFAKFHKDEEYLEDAVATLMNEVMDKEVLVNREYKNAESKDCISMQLSETKADVVQTLLGQGLLLLDGKKDSRFSKLMSDYRGAQEEARKKHLNIWRYGDVTDDDAAEFGMER